MAAGKTELPRPTEQKTSKIGWKAGMLERLKGRRNSCNSVRGGGHPMHLVMGGRAKEGHFNNYSLIQGQ